MEINKNKLQNLLDEWLKFREEEIATLTKEDKKYLPHFEERIPTILKDVPQEYKTLVNKILEEMYDNIMDYSNHWNRKHYMTGFSDSLSLIISALSGGASNETK